MYERIGDALGKLIIGLFATCCVFVPLGLWKLIEIVVWLFGHVSVNVN